jgi:hypothetical protein
MNQSNLDKSTGSGMYELARSIGAQVFHPNYYNGRWRIHIRGKVKICSNHITANAWAKYFIRRGYQSSIDNIYLSKVVGDQ